MSSRRPSRSAIADEAIGADRELALIHMPGPVREAFRALFALDAAMGDVVAKANDPTLGRIKLAWWREQLEALDVNSPPAEPRLRAAADELIARAISGHALAELEPGWATLLDEEVDSGLVASRGECLFQIGGQLLGSSDERLGEAGALYALASVARRGVPELLELARAYVKRLAGHRFERRLRSLTMLARAAARDLDRREPEESRARVLAMLAHRWSGRIC